MEPVSISLISLHISRSTVAFVHAGETRLLQPQGGSVQYRRPGFLVVGPRGLPGVGGVECASLWWQLRGKLWKGTTTQKITMCGPFSFFDD